ncbi:hypothetical protein BaRGS_00011541 [Batillaria attramentaria]|uniref:Uncharacterized protein n=1 Tax=Batillaria attramentaria TaxID=370345 RepID=A0ABD0LE31_9CAEN
MCVSVYRSPQGRGLDRQSLTIGLLASRGTSVVSRCQSRKLDCSFEKTSGAVVFCGDWMCCLISWPGELQVDTDADSQVSSVCCKQACFVILPRHDMRGSGENTEETLGRAM